MITRPADLGDADAISALLTANIADRGAMLFGDWSVDMVRDFIRASLLVVVAIEGPKLVGVLLTSEKTQASAPPVVAMLKAWPGAADAYVYGPVCIDEAARGKGVLEALYAEVTSRLPGREAVLFIKADNVRSRHAHAKLGMTEVAQFSLEGEDFLVFSSAGAKS